MRTEHPNGPQLPHHLDIEHCAGSDQSLPIIGSLIRFVDVGAQRQSRRSSIRSSRYWTFCRSWRQVLASPGKWARAQPRRPVAGSHSRMGSSRKGDTCIWRLGSVVPVLRDHPSTLNEYVWTLLYGRRVARSGSRPTRCAARCSRRREGRRPRRAATQRPWRSFRSWRPSPPTTTQGTRSRPFRSPPPVLSDMESAVV